MDGRIGPYVGPPDPWIRTPRSGPSWTAAAVLTAQVVVASYSGLWSRGGRTREIVGDRDMASLRSMFWFLSSSTRGTRAAATSCAVKEMWDRSAEQLSEVAGDSSRAQPNERKKEL